MKVLFDSSAFYKRYSGEAGVQRVMQVQQTATQVILAVHCKTEIVSALSRQRREDLFTEQEYARLLFEIEGDFVDLTVLPLTPAVEQHAFAALRRSPVRAMDALHIATALVARVDRFVTADKRQAQAAELAGLNTELIEA